MGKHSTKKREYILTTVGSAIATVVVALVVVVLGSIGTAQANGPEYKFTDAIVQVADQDTPSVVWDALIEAGYTGDPDDGCECLYVALGKVVEAEVGPFQLGANGWDFLGE
jgi:hypothetical protein